MICLKKKLGGIEKCFIKIKVDDIYIYMKFKTFIRLAFSEKGRPSSKRIMGGLMMLVVIVVSAISVVKYGMTDNNKDVVMTEIITSSSLLGLTTLVNGFTKFESNRSQKTKITKQNAIQNNMEQKYLIGMGKNGWLEGLGG